MDYFPINVAQGKAFCNRKKERSLLKEFIKNGRHSVIVAPRRYGKTSLINQVLLELGLKHVIMELTMAVTLKDVEQIIIKSVSELLQSILPTPSKAKQKILGLFKWLNPELTLSAHGQKIVFHPDWNKLGEVNSIAEILKKLDEAATLVNKRVVIVMDEFQQLSEIGSSSEKNENEYAIEAAIRNAMQYCKNTSYVFSGSHRQMLFSMFNDKSRPFYNSCEIITIERIERSEYQSFIQSLAIDRWRKPLEDPCINRILDLSELHPHYINRLCGYFWIIGEYPTLDAIENYWGEIVQSKKSELTEDIFNLSKNQRKLLSYLAHQPDEQPGSSKVCTAIGISEASNRQALKALCAKDYVYQSKDNLYKVLDPAMASLIRLLG